MPTPLLTQIRPTYFSVDCGMAYLIRLCDGRFIAIDSAYGEYDEVDRLYSLMQEQNVTGGKPCVAAWFFTHPHNDHTGGFINMSLSHADKISVERVIYSFPTEKYPNTHDHEGFLAAIARFGAATVTPRRGDELTFGGATFSVLYTADDCYVEPVNVNETSLTMRMTLGNYSVMWLGDLQNVGSRIVMELYSPEELKCDILQVGHHGYWGGSDALYRAVDPEILIWPMPEYRYLDMMRDPYNRFFSDPENHIRLAFISGIEEVTLDMTAPILATEPYVCGKHTADISSKAVSALGWSCITGGSMGYVPASLSFGDGDCTLDAQSGRTLLQTVQRGQTALTSAYSFDLTYTACSDCGELGLVFDCPTPTTPDSYTVHPLPLKVGEEVTVSLTVDRALRAAELSANGKKQAIALEASEPCDVILILKGSKIKISAAEFINLG